MRLFRGFRTSILTFILAIFSSQLLAEADKVFREFYRYQDKFEGVPVVALKNVLAHPNEWLLLDVRSAKRERFQCFLGLLVLKALAQKRMSSEREKLLCTAQ